MLLKFLNMKATQRLKDEHQGVLLMLNILEAVCKKLSTGEKVEPKHLQQIVEFLQIFVDKCHHGKEEDVLFPAMEQAGIPKENGPIGVMLVEHETGRGYVREMKTAIEKYASGDATLAANIVNAANNFISFLRPHIEKEDNILYAMADQVLPAEQQEKLFTEFEKIENEKIGSGTHEKFHELLHQLKQIYL